MDRVELAGSILIMAAELGLLLAFFTGLFGRRTTACRARALVAVTVAASRLLMLAVIRYAPLGSLFLLTADLLVVSLLFPVRMRKRVLFLLLYYFSLAASEVLGMLLAVRILGSGEDFLGTNSAAEMLAQIFSKGFLLLLLLPSLQRRRSIRVLWLRCREALRAALAPLLCCLVLVLLIPHLWQPGNRPLLIALGIIALSLAAVNHLSLDRWLIRADLHRVRSSLDTQRHLIEGWLRRLKAGREGVRRLYHDLRGHFVHLLGLLRRGQSNQAVTYLEELDHTLQSLRTEPYTGNPVVDALLSHAQGVCRSREIRLDCRGQLPEDLSIQDSDLVGLVGNALDNAVKASPRGGTITVQCSYRAGWLRFRVENPVAATIPKGQGLGLSIMRDIVQRYAGWLEVCTEPKRYRITIYVHDGETESS